MVQSGTMPIGSTLCTKSSYDPTVDAHTGPLSNLSDTPQSTNGKMADLSNMDPVIQPLHQETLKILSSPARFNLSKDEEWSYKNNLE